MQHPKVNGLTPIFQGDAAAIDDAFEGAKRKVSALMEWNYDLFFSLGMTPFLVTSLTSDQHKTIVSKNANHFIGFKAGIFGAQG